MGAIKLSTLVTAFIAAVIIGPAFAGLVQYAYVELVTPEPEYRPYWATVAHKALACAVPKQVHGLRSRRVNQHPINENGLISLSGGGWFKS